MKTRAALCMVATMAFAIPSFNASAAGALDGQVLTSMCNYAAQNDKTRFRRTMKSSGIKFRKVYDKFECNGLSLLRFAMSRDADAVGPVLVKQLSKKQLRAPEADGQTVLQWAEANGKGTSVTATAVKDRIK